MFDRDKFYTNCEIDDLFEKAISMGLDINELEGKITLSQLEKLLNVIQ